MATLISASDYTSTQGAGVDELQIGASDFGSCENLRVEIVIANDPCAVGQHYCPETAECLVTDDGLDYTCTCNTDELRGEYFGGYGSGLQCFNFDVRSKHDTFAEAQQQCRASRQNIFKVRFENNEKLII